MKTTNSSQTIKRVIIIAIVSQLLLMIFIYAFSKSFFYSIISLCGALIGMSSFLSMIKITDMVLKKRKGLVFFSLVVPVKAVIIALAVFGVYRLFRESILFPLLGFSIVVFSIGIEGVYLAFRPRGPRNRALEGGVSHGKT